MRVYKAEKHKNGGKRDGYRPETEKRGGDKRTPPRFENFKGEPVE